MMYFRADSNLRTGAAFTDMAGDGAPITKGNVAHREIIKGLGYPNGRTLTALRMSQAISGDYWLECSDDLWSAVLPLLTANEFATITSAKPVGWINEVGYPDYTGFNRPKNMMAVTDSIGYYGPVLNTDQGTGSYVYKAVQNRFGTPVTPKNGNTGREHDTPDYGLVHMGIGGTHTDSADYNGNHTDKFDQQYKTMSLNKANMTIFLALGSNDMNAGDTPVTAWAELSNLIGLFGAEFPLARILVATLIRRGEAASQNADIHSLNQLIRANVTHVFEAEQAHPDFSATSGDSTGDQYHVDTAHLSAIGLATMAAAFEIVL